MGTSAADHDEDMAAATETDPMENVVFYKSQPNALNLAQNAIPEDSIWTSSPVVCGEPDTGDMDRPVDGMMMEIDLDGVQPLTPPDGGWGWLIVLGSFMCMFLVDGVCFSYGIFLSELEATFGASKMQMTLAGSLLTGCYFMVGPVVSGLMNRFGARKLVVIGSVISSAAIVGSSFATDVNTFIGVFGVIGGIGYGLIYLPAATIVTSWFVRKRATVTGIITAGSGIGVTCYSIAIPHLIRKFTWRGSILLLAAINLNAAVAGVLFRPLISNQPKVTKSKSVVGVIVDPDSTDSSFPNVRGAAGNSRLPRHSSTILVQRKTSVKQLARQYVDSGAIAEYNRSKGLDENPANSTTGLNDGWTKQFTRRDTSRKSNTSWDDIIITHGNQLVQVPEDATLANTSADRLPMLSVEAVNHIVEGVLSRQSFVSNISLAVPDRTTRRKPSGMILSGSQRWLASTASQIGQVTVRPSENAVVYLKVRPDNMGSATYFASAVSLRTVGDLNTSAIDEQTVRDAIVREIRKEVARPVHRKDLFLSGSLIHIDEYITNPQVESYIRTVTSPAEETQTRNPILAMLRNMFGLNILKSPTFQLLNISSIITMIGKFYRFLLFVWTSNYFQPSACNRAYAYDILSLSGLLCLHLHAFECAQS
ncbi:Monocarboxylate transporter 12-B [Paragonimus heterotremus]|uniref:Monocarboxylate transporter 12-B n=1 Tax=Paragonimus heterotremus TaxID=100268 RepID=A0A8J4SNI8_9TREM|nr:Monocarboxylate transporter 12-B [Paragonimus heterotremus]